MKRRDNIIYLTMRVMTVLLATSCSLSSAFAQGIPFFRNYTADEYHANNTNFDIETDEYGNVFAANFEGLMYYDYAEWRIIHTPGITRVTVVYRASDNTIWVGGYNYFGKITRKANGEITLQRIGDENLFRGEVNGIYENDGKLQFIVSNGVIYNVKDNKVSIAKAVSKESSGFGMPDDAVDIDTDGISVAVMKNAGLMINDKKHNTHYTITDENGLCSSNVTNVTYDGRGHLWGSTGKGIFAIQIPTAITRFTAREGLMGSVLTIEELNGKIYAGTDDGLYRQEGYRFVKVPEFKNACWQLKKNDKGLLAATAHGIFRLYPDGKVTQLTATTAMAVLDDGDRIYSGEINGVFLIQADGKDHKRVCDLENVTKIMKDDTGTIWTQSLYGSVWYKKAGDIDFKQYKSGEKSEEMLTVVMNEGKAVIISEGSEKPFPYPLVSFPDENGITWLTNNEGKKLYRWKHGKQLNDMDRLLFPIHEMQIRTIYTKKNEIWLGNDNGLIIINTQADDPVLMTKPKLYIRSVKLGSDSILWGGFGDMPDMLAKLNHNENDLSFTFSIDHPSISGETLYRYRLNDGSWSAWSPSMSAHYANLRPGNYTFSVQATDAANHKTDITSASFIINSPFYYRWYMYLLYMLLTLVLFYTLFRLRLQRLEKDKIRLERIVKDRTAEVVRLEKMATAGKLTQGLIDRILNPLNYINNFSKLSEGLIKDVKANIEDEKEHMDEEIYEDTVDVLDMLTGNLQKVSEHGQNTTRTLKAMEEMLKDRSGGIVPMDLSAVIKQDEEMLHKYYKKEIEQYNIRTVFDCPDEHLQIEGNAEQLSKTIMSLLANSVYAVVKKASKTDSSPEICLKETTSGNAVIITVRDNGIGIENTIIDKVFDPFFTTKTTGEAAGVGLYLSREIIQNHGGDISVKSVKDEYSEFTFTLPYKK